MSRLEGEVRNILVDVIKDARDRMGAPKLPTAEFVALADTIDKVAFTIKSSDFPVGDLDVRVSD